MGCVRRHVFASYTPPTTIPSADCSREDWVDDGRQCLPEKGHAKQKPQKTLKIFAKQKRSKNDTQVFRGVGGYPQLLNHFFLVESKKNEKGVGGRNHSNEDSGYKFQSSLGVKVRIPKKPIRARTGYSIYWTVGGRSASTMDAADLLRGAYRLVFFGLYIITIGACIRQATLQTRYSTLVVGVVGVVGVGAVFVASAVNRSWRRMGQSYWGACVLWCVQGISGVVGIVGVDVGIFKRGFGDVLAFQADGTAAMGLVFVTAGMLVIIFVDSDYDVPVPPLPLYDIGVQEPKKVHSIQEQLLPQHPDSLKPGTYSAPIPFPL